MYPLYVYYGRVGYVPAEWWCSSCSRSWITFLSSVPWKIVCEMTSTEAFGEQKFPIFWKKKFSKGFGKKFADNCDIIYNDNTITAQILYGWRYQTKTRVRAAGDVWTATVYCTPSAMELLRTDAARQLRDTNVFRSPPERLPR